MTAAFDMGDEGGGGFSFDTIRRLLPVLLLAMIVAGNLFFVITVVLPGWQTHQDVAQQLDQAEARLTQQANRPVSNESQVLQHQLDAAQTRIVDTSQGFLTAPQAEDLIEQLYTYADSYGVIVQALRISPDAVGGGAPYYVRVLRLEVRGQAVTNVMSFLTALREATISGVRVDNVVLSSDKDGATLVFDVMVFTSPLASGGALDAAQDVVVASMSVDPSTNTMISVGTVTPPPTTDVGVVVDNPDGTPMSSVDVAWTSTPVPQQETVECPGAPPTVFQVGDQVIVDFRTDSTLRIMRQPRVDDNPVAILAHAEDGDVLQLLGGPVCGSWMEMPIYYWYVSYGNFMGWAGEASDRARWMCPMDDPDCNA